MLPPTKPSSLAHHDQNQSNSLFFVLLLGLGSLVVSMATGFYRRLLGWGLWRWWLLWHLRLRCSQWRCSWRRRSGLLRRRAVLRLASFRIRQLQNGNNIHGSVHACVRVHVMRLYMNITDTEQLIYTHWCLCVYIQVCMHACMHRSTSDQIHSNCCSFQPLIQFKKPLTYSTYYHC